MCLRVITTKTTVFTGLFRPFFEAQKLYSMSSFSACHDVGPQSHQFLNQFLNFSIPHLFPFVLRMDEIGSGVMSFFSKTKEEATFADAREVPVDMQTVKFQKYIEIPDRSPLFVWHVSC